MPQNGQTHFNKLVANAKSVSDHFGILCMKGLSYGYSGDLFLVM